MTDKFIIEGLAGKRTLRGEIGVKGAKNAVLKSFAAAVLFDDEVVLANVPEIEDVHRMLELLEALGATTEQRGEGTYAISPKEITGSSLDDAIARKLRASIVLTGPLLARFGSVTFPHPGGDIIGPRPINLFIEGFERMGATVAFDGSRYTLSAPQGLIGCEIFFMFMSVTATETLMMAATRAKGTTTLKNAAMEPEIVELAEYLKKCGARITGAGTPTIVIEGSGALLARGQTWHTIPDRIEAGTFLLLGALAAEEITITDCNPSHVEILTQLLLESGVSMDIGETSITVRGSGEPRAMQVRTHEYPGFATDLQPPMVVYLTQAHGESTVFESIWGGRLGYTQDLVRMGADITQWNPLQITVKGPTPLVGRELESPDIRAGLAFLMAGAIASGTSSLDHIYHIDRGYERIEDRLGHIGLNIKRV